MLKLLKTSSITLLLFILFIMPVFGGATNETKKGTAELEVLRDQIQKIKNEISQNRGESDQLRKLLEQNEAEVEKATKESKELNEKIRKQNKVLESLKKQQSDQAETLSKHKNFLFEQVRVAYMQQNHGTLKRVLNQEDPSARSRSMVYHRYFSAARSEKIVQIDQQLNQLQALQKVVALETEQLRIWQHSHNNKLQDLQHKKQQRQLLIAELDQRVSSKGAQLKRMKKEAKDLSALIASLKKKAKKATVTVAKNTLAFAKLKGKLHWPATGGILHRFGTSRNGSSLTWQGVLIHAPKGSDVRTVSAGRVIFSDWFQNLGRLIIVDHGDGYMSLYGHNQALFRSVGDTLKTGEVIASVGDSGGRKNSGLYFEVRQKGTAVNPATWCKGYYK